MKENLKTYFTKQTIFLWIAVIVINTILEIIHKLTGWYTEFHMIVMTLILVIVLGCMFPSVFIEKDEEVKMKE
ncbi:hypothetical protein [Psychrobacillus phage Perkons]|nr:hypothetical protein [Psychrobacillus phage Perkons]